MNRYKVQLVAKLVAFTEIEVEAESEILAGFEARKEAAKLPVYHWDVEEVDYIAPELPDIEVNDCSQVEKDNA